MSVGAISGSNSGGAFGSMSSDDFIKVLTAELANQDPLDPQDSGALLEQLSSLRNIESQLSLQQQLESLVMQNQVAAAGGMIGKEVEGLDDQNNAVSGLVTAIRVEDGKAILELDSGKAINIDRVSRITELQA